MDGCLDVGVRECECVCVCACVCFCLCVWDLPNGFGMFKVPKPETLNPPRLSVCECQKNPPRSAVS